MQQYVYLDIWSEKYTEWSHLYIHMCEQKIYFKMLTYSNFSSLFFYTRNGMLSNYHKYPLQQLIMV